MGHERQSAGLINALQSRLDVQVREIALERGATLALLKSSDHPAPDLIIGAGHDTHIPMLVARWRFGGRTVVLMRPSLPLRWFDLCVAPEHDGIGDHPRVITSMGALNDFQPSDQDRQTNTALILLGGPSKHFQWDSGAVIAQVSELVKSRHKITRWMLSTSRRTPSDLLKELSPLSGKVELVSGTDCPPDWLRHQLTITGEVWATVDSVSMLYEALTAGCAVGTLDVPPTRSHRLQMGLQSLYQKGWATPLAVANNRSLTRPQHPFNESQRIANWLLQNWFRHLQMANAG